MKPLPAPNVSRKADAGGLSNSICTIQTVSKGTLLIREVKLKKAWERKSQAKRAA
jgi:hypothetical protein